MRAYEIVYILDAGLERAAVDAKLEAFHAVLGGQVSTVDHWGVRQLAYPIDKAETAYYAVVHAEVDPTALPEFERRLRLDEETMRYLIVVNEGQPTSGASVLADPPSTGQEDGEDALDGGAGEDAPDEVAGSDTTNDDAHAEGESSDADADSADAGAGSAATDAAESPDASADAESADAASDAEPADADADAASDASASEAAEDDQPPRSGPPEFSGARGRRRRHEGPPIVLLNYKDVTTLSRFLTEQGRILPKRTTKVTARFQRQLGTAIKRARYLALIPYMKEHGA